MPIPPLLRANNAVPELGAEHVVNDQGEHCIPVDECIVPAVRALWDAGVVTLSSCCGHAAPGEIHPWGVITIQTIPGERQRGAVVVRRERYEELLAATAQPAAAEAPDAREVEIAALRDLAQGRLEHFQESEKSRGHHFMRADRALTLLARVASYLDYMEERGYSSVRVIRSDVYQLLREEGREPMPSWHDRDALCSAPAPREGAADA